MNNIFIISVSLIFLVLITIYRAFRIKKRKVKLNNALNANYFLETINRLIEENKYNLLEERIRLKVIDAYGNEDLKKWIGNPPLDEILIEKSINNGSKRLKEGIPYFWEKVILKQFSGPDIFLKNGKLIARLIQLLMMK